MITIPKHRKGDTWDGMKLTLTDNNNVPINLTNYSAKAQFKQTKNSAVAFEFKTEDNTITLNSIGEIVLVGRKMNVPASKYISDIELVRSDDNTKTISDINWEIYQDITN